MTRSEDRRTRPPVPGWLGPLCEPVYRAAVAWRNAGFDRGRGVEAFSVPVVSVGNLSVGGTGKTPMVALVVRLLLDAGRRPGIVMRGYKSAAGEMGDEQREYLAMFGDRVPVVADPDRRRAIRGLMARGAADCIVLDDGFQHRRVRRDLDIVLLDGTRDVFADHLLPRGWLREPVSSLARAGVVVLTHADALDVDARERVWRRVREVTPKAAQVEACHAWSGLRVFEGGVERREPVEWLRGRAVVVAPGIGNPTAFSAQTRAAGAEVVHECFMRDHHHWTPSDVQGVLADAGRHGGGCSCVMTTMKDWVKVGPLVRGLPDSGVSWCVPVLEMRITRGEEALRGRIEDAAGHG